MNQIEYIGLTCLYSYIFPTKVNLLDFGRRNVIKRTTTEASKPSPERKNYRLRLNVVNYFRTKLKGVGRFAPSPKQ